MLIKLIVISDSLESLTQSSETSSEESDDTVDSETEHIPLDESICPPGCDKELYEMAFFMREKRYECEFQIKEKQREIELLHKELETDTKRLKVIDNNLKSNQAELEDFVVFENILYDGINDVCTFEFNYHSTFNS